MIKGAPYAGIGTKRLQTMLHLLNIKKEDRFIDLGSGDGRIVVEAEKLGAKSFGIEINPLIFVISFINLKLKKSNNSSIILGDYWKHDLSQYNKVSIWGTKHMVENIEKKLMKELKPNSLVVSNHYKFQNWKVTKHTNDVYMYIKK